MPIQPPPHSYKSDAHFLAVSLNHDADTDKELVAHGYSNLLAGALGTVYVPLSWDSLSIRYDAENPGFAGRTTWSMSILYCAYLTFMFYCLHLVLNLHKISFYRVGGDTRIAGFLLAGANVLLLLVGTGPIAYIRKSLRRFQYFPSNDLM